MQNFDFNINQQKAMLACVEAFVRTMPAFDQLVNMWNVCRKMHMEECMVVLVDEMELNHHHLYKQWTHFTDLADSIEVDPYKIVAA